jgi:phosphatidate cytidylyltransferase
MALNLQTFKTRTLTATVFVIIMLVGLLWNKWSFLILFSLIHFGCWIEYQKLTGIIDNRYATIGLFHRYGIILIGWGLMLNMADDDMRLGDVSITSVGVIICLTGLAAILFDIIKNFTNEAVIAIGYSVAGLLYISLPWVCMMAIRNTGATFYNSSSTPEFSFVIPIILIASIWINDTMAYLVGSFIGKTSLSKISPKKPGKEQLAAPFFA